GQDDVSHRPLGALPLFGAHLVRLLGRHLLLERLEEALAGGEAVGGDQRLAQVCLHGVHGFGDTLGDRFGDGLLGGRCGFLAGLFGGLAGLLVGFGLGGRLGPLGLGGFLGLFPVGLRLPAGLFGLGERLCHRRRDRRIGGRCHGPGTG